ncbi:wax ester/triacylglycerol synthase domain-containing protein [Mycobacterium sp.]|jgi:diacylglycerol O-acyltransferase|uniref:wax ester/triacylglycerol synthase domain-containing protein n=1 Tax=Mycobacterium sp. TaxID=1785 RepID=UPI002D4308C2|nr:wax ester/triacylglycerol synthase domain-containing protein [Mycobacterium sp.]HZA11720.1 wax ester/triacylglycerol synthase domain-containing protein [Mycobacterium sp.]
MVRLSGMDALSLHTETARLPAHIVAVIVIEASDRLSHQRLHTLVASSLPGLARFRSRLVGKPFGLGQPVWAEIDDFNPSRQLRRIAVPAPGDQDDLAELIAKLTTRPLHRHLPLWQAWSIEGLDGGRWALALKMSPATTQGISGVASVLSRLLAVDPDDNVGDHLPVEQGLGKEPSMAGLVADTAVELVGNQLAGVRVLGTALPGALRAAVDRLRGVDARDGVPVPRTAFNEPLTEQRAVAFASIPLADIDAVRDRFGVGGPEVFLAACTWSVRTWLQRRDIVPDHPLLMQTPLPGGLSFGHARLPVQLDNPVQVLTELHVESGSPASDIAKFAELVAPGVVHSGMELYSWLKLARRLPPMAHGLVAHLPGPGTRVYCAGAEVAGLYVVAPLLEGAGLNITAVAHGEAMDVAVCVCPDNVPGVDAIARGVVDAVAQLRSE